MREKTLPPTPALPRQGGGDTTAVCLTVGDPTGIGPEITAKFLASSVGSSPLVVIGDIPNLKHMAQSLDIQLPESNACYVDVAGPDVLPGRVAYEAVRYAVKHIADGKASALVTGPASKENLQRAGLRYPGHTEMLETLANRYFPQNAPYQSDMLFAYNNFRMLLLTRHVPLSQVSAALTQEQAARSIENLITYLQQQGITKPKIAVMGCNPHAGEVGGDEKRRVLVPAIERINAAGQAQLIGPLAADALFRNFDANNIPYDAYVAAYHDQGLIPFKMIAGYEAVNVTIGLPFVRTSVSHGTAPDIAGRGVANPASLQAAFGLIAASSTSLRR